MLTNTDFDDTHVDLDWHHSDHSPIITTIFLQPVKHADKGRYKPKVFLKPDLTNEELIRIGSHKDWPDKPALEVAHSLRLTKTVFVPFDACAPLRSFIKSFDHDHSSLNDLVLESAS